MKWRFLVLAALVTLPACSEEPGVVTPPPIAPAPIVTLVGTELDVGFARITWDVTHGTGHEFWIYRRLQTKPWKNMFTLTTNIEGRMVLEDTSVSPGQQYSYRVLAEGASPDAYGGEVTIVVPQ